MVTHDPEQARAVGRNVQVIDGQITDHSVYAPTMTTLQLLLTVKDLSWKCLIITSN